MLMTGGLGFKEQMTEAEVMSEYLQKHHQIDQTRILLEDQSTSTEQNLRNVQPLLKAHHITLSEPIIIATSDFSSFARQSHSKTSGLSTDPDYKRTNALVYSLQLLVKRILCFYQWMVTQRVLNLISNF